MAPSFGEPPLHVFSHPLVVLAVAFGVALAATPVMAWVARRAGFLDRPAGHKAHGRPHPLLGGVAIYLGIAGALVLAKPWQKGLWPLLAAATLLVVAGLWDDRFGLSVLGKLAAQGVAAAILVGAGLVVDLPLPSGVAPALTVLWLVGLANAFNLLDNMDGVAAGTAAVAAIFLGILAPAGSLAVAVCAAVAGAATGFAVFNFPPSRLFMGDAGSHALGLLLAAAAVLVQRAGSGPGSWLAPAVVLGVAIFDTTLVSVSRLRRRRNPLTTPGNDHLSHRLAARLGGVRAAVVAIYALGAACGVLGWIVDGRGAGVAGTIGGLVVVFAVMAIVWLERPGPRDKPRADDRAGAPG